MLTGAMMTDTGAPKSISAQYKRPPHGRKERPGANVLHKRLQSLAEGDKLTMAVAFAKEAVSVVQRWLLKEHLSPFEAEAAKRYAYIMGRFDRYFVEAGRTARSQNYERAYGADQELEIRAFDGSLPHYEKQARRARRHYDKLQNLLAPYADISGRNPMKDALDQMCCEDIEPPAQHRRQIAAVLRGIGKAFGVGNRGDTRRGRQRKGRS